MRACHKLHPHMSVPDYIIGMAASLASCVHYWDCLHYWTNFIIGLIISLG